MQRFYEINRMKRRYQRISALPEVLYSSSLRRGYLGHKLGTFVAQYLNRRRSSKL